MPVDATRESIYPDQWSGPAMNLEVDYAGQASAQTPLHPSLLLPSFSPPAFFHSVSSIFHHYLSRPPFFIFYILFYFALCTPSD